MFGLIVKLTTVRGKRKEMIGILREHAVDMLGCLSDFVAGRCSEPKRVLGY
jgi:hypothetical protein